ncbi:MAG: hypothetical protein ACRDSN_06535 [Pseudonocardiaceae bacterium]
MTCRTGTACQLRRPCSSDTSVAILLIALVSALAGAFLDVGGLGDQYEHPVGHRRFDAPGGRGLPILAARGTR